MKSFDAAESNTEPRWGIGALEVALIAVLAVAVRLIHLDHTPFVDELNHMLAAHSLLERGTLQIGDGGLYTRTWLFTYLVAGFFRVFGETLVVGRLPAVLAGAGLVVAVFLWLRSASGRAAAWIAALLLCFSPGAIYLSQQVRFYTVQALLFWLGAVAVYRLAASPRRTAPRAALLAVGAGVAFLLALHLQITTAVGIAGLCLWAVLALGPGAARRISAHRRRIWIWGGLAVAIALFLAVVVGSRFVDRAVATFQYADLWAESNRENVRYYHWLFLDQYATLWTLFPLWVLIAAVARPRPTVFCVCIFATAFVFHSLAAWKQERYLFYALPMFFAVSGMGIAEVLAWIRPRLEGALARAAGRRGPGTASAALAAVLLAGSALFAAFGNGASSYTYKMLTLSDAEWDMDQLYRGQPDWLAVDAVLQPLADSSAVVVGSTELKALYYLDRLDLLLNANYLVSRSGVAPEFSPFPKLARPVISTPASLDRVMDCYPTGLVVIEQGQWRRRSGVLPAAADYLERHATAVPLPERSGLMAFRWRNSDTAVPASCSTITPHYSATP